MSRLYRPFVVAVFLLSLSLVGLPVSFATNDVLNTIQKINSMPPEMQLEVLSKLTSPAKELKELLKQNVEKVFLKELKGHKEWVRALCFSPDGSKLATGSYDKTAKIWDVRTGKELHCFTGHKGEVNSVSFSPDGSKLATGSEDWKVRIWDLQTGKNIYTREGYFQVISLCFSPDGLKLASGWPDGKVRVWDVQEGKELYTLKQPCNGVNSFHFSLDGSRLSVGSQSGTIQIWDTRSGKSIQSLRGPNGWLTASAFSPDGSTVIFGSSNKLLLWDVKTDKLIQVLHEYPDNHWISSVSFSPDGSKFVVGIKPENGIGDKVAEVRDTKTGNLLQRCMGHRKEVGRVCFSPDSNKLATGSFDKTTRLWDIQARQDVIDEINHLGPAQILLLYILHRGQEGLKPNERVSLTKTEKALRQEYKEGEEELPELLRLKKSYDSLSPGLQEVMKKTFRVIE